MIGVVDYGAGNLRSVQNMLDALGVVNCRVQQETDTRDRSGLILPGVGAFGSAMARLRESGLADVVGLWLEMDLPFLGICLGMQLLFETSEESPGSTGFGRIPGTCTKITGDRVPQIGWNRVQFAGNDPLFDGIPDGSWFYFLHSYRAPATANGITGMTDYAGPFPSALKTGNCRAVQFHPEKSGDTGARLLTNWGDVMLPVRLIPCLDIDNGRVVKGVRFRSLRDAGDPVERADLYNREGADEIAVLDVGATVDSRRTLLTVIRNLARNVFVPLSAGGGVRTVDDMRAMLEAGADKVSLCSAALNDPDLLTQGANRFGSQCVVISVDATRSGNSWRAMAAGGTRDSGRDAVTWAREAVDRGAGEILLNAIDRDGTRNGYDLALIHAVSNAVTVPVIASGGAGNADHMAEAVGAGASAVLLASVLHDGLNTIGQLKTDLRKRGVRTRC